METGPSAWEAIPYVYNSSNIYKGNSRNTNIFLLGSLPPQFNSQDNMKKEIFFTSTHTYSLEQIEL